MQGKKIKAVHIPAQQETHQTLCIKKREVSAKMQTEHYANSHQKPSLSGDSTSCRTNREFPQKKQAGKSN
jgi:hypothetical protein